MIGNLIAQYRPGCRRGFSLIEVLIGMMVLSIGLASAFMLGWNNARLIENNQNLAAASSLAEYMLEELRNSEFDMVVDGSDGPMNAMGVSGTGGMFTRAWTVQSGAPSIASTDLKTVVVSVAWTQLGQTRSFTLTGVISR